MVTKVKIGYGSSTILTEMLLIKNYIRKRFEIEAEIKLLSCRQKLLFTIDLATEVMIRHDSSTNLVEISLIET